MKKLSRKFMGLFRQACPRCHGMGNIEMPDGSVKDCPVCKGKGMV